MNIKQNTGSFKPYGHCRLFLTLTGHVVEVDRELLKFKCDSPDTHPVSARIF